MAVLMRLGKPNCPECGQPARGTLELIHGCAEFSQHGADLFDYDGYTDVFWDGQMTCRQDNSREYGPDNLHIALCRNGHEWSTSIDEVEVTEKADE